MVPQACQPEWLTLYQLHDLREGRVPVSSCVGQSRSKDGVGLLFFTLGVPREVTATCSPPRIPLVILGPSLPADPRAESARREGIGNFAEMSTKGQIVSLPAPHSPYHSL